MTFCATLARMTAKKATVKRKAPAKAKKRVGRPSFKITPEVLERARLLASQGLTEKNIAHRLGICHDTLIEKKKQFSEFSESIEGGKAEGIDQMSNALFQSGLEGNFQAQKYYLSTRDRDNWGETLNVAAKVEVDIDDHAAAALAILRKSVAK